MKEHWSAEDLASIPDELLRSESQRRNNRRRKTFGGGRPRKPRCWCKQMTLEMAAKLGHTCQFPPSLRSWKA